MDLDVYLKPCHIEKEKLRILAVKFARIYKHLAGNADDQFLATPVNVLPSGLERGKFIAIDLGGTNLRVGLVELLGQNGAADPIRLSHEKSWAIDEHLKMEKAEKLFLWVGDCIASVVRDCLDVIVPQQSPTDPQKQVVPLGITFSFPMIQTSIREATLMQMGKGFAITSNLNLGHLLLSGYERHTRPSSGGVSLPALEITAITNDSVATLASLAYEAQATSNDRVVMGLIVGTGVNATAPMKLKDLHVSKRASLKLPASVDSAQSTTIVNTEWTIKGAAPPLREMNLITRWDLELDKHTEVPGFQPFEYMVAGRYLGELIRIVTLEYFQECLVLDEALLPDALTARNELTTAYVSKVVASYDDMDKLLSKLNHDMPGKDPGRWTWSIEAVSAFKHIAEVLKHRSASLVAAASVGLLLCSDQLQLKSSVLNGVASLASGDMIIAYTGGMISQYPGYRALCQDLIDDLVATLTDLNHGKVKVKLKGVEYGGISGAGVLAGTVWNLPRRGSITFTVPPILHNVSHS